VKGRIKQALAGQFMHPSGVVGAITGRMMAMKNRGRIRWAMGEMCAGQVENVLEIGYGPGVAIEELRLIAPECTIVGVDSSPVMHSQASRRNRVSVNNESIRLHQMSATEYTGQDAPFDLIFSINALPFCENPSELVLNCVGWLRPGGRMVIVHQPPMKVLDADSLQARQDEFMSWLTDAGLAPGRSVRHAAKPNPVLFVEGLKSGLA
jgi:trans-aconitate methyltransferase